tara:strand:+ start:102 stop:413 length:312 start_codon:yes stop_codon:yes gene_type:complete
MRGDVAQLEEHLLCKQGVVGSSPIISTMDYLIALFIGVVVFRFLRNSISSLASIPPELDTDDVVEISQSFICNKCGTELTINRQSVVANEPPKHCKEAMEPLN